MEVDNEIKGDRVPHENTYFNKKKLNEMVIGHTYLMGWISFAVRSITLDRVSNCD